MGLLQMIGETYDFWNISSETSIKKKLYCEMGDQWIGHRNLFFSCSKTHTPKTQPKFKLKKIRTHRWIYCSSRQTVKLAQKVEMRGGTQASAAKWTRGSVRLIRDHKAGLFQLSKESLLEWKANYEFDHWSVNQTFGLTSCWPSLKKRFAEFLEKARKKEDFPKMHTGEFTGQFWFKKIRSGSKTNQF